MNHLYLDSSAVLRFLHRQPEHIDLRGRPEAAVASQLTRVECRRSLDRARLAGMRPQTLDARRRALDDLMEFVSPIGLTAVILARVSGPLPSPLGSLNAIHLVSALAWREEYEESISFATHDLALARAARLYGFEVLGCDAH